MRQAILLGCVRKSTSLIDRPAEQPLRSLAYFEPLPRAVERERVPAASWQHLDFNLGSYNGKERYEGGMNSSHVAYEDFRGFSLHHLLGGSKELVALHRKAWEGITRPFTRHGQVHREFDSNWDWMHQGERYVSFFPLGMADPHDDLYRDCSVGFAAMCRCDDSLEVDPQPMILRQSLGPGGSGLRGIGQRIQASGPGPMDIPIG